MYLGLWSFAFTVLTSSETSVAPQQDFASTSLSSPPPLGQIKLYGSFLSLLGYRKYTPGVWSRARLALPYLFLLHYHCGVIAQETSLSTLLPTPISPGIKMQFSAGGPTQLRGFYHFTRCGNGSETNASIEPNHIKSLSSAVKLLPNP